MPKRNFGPPRSRKAKKRPYASLKTLLDRVFSEWLRRYAARQYNHGDGSDYALCATCQTPYHWQRLQCGHFVSRVHLATRWEPRNCAPQCMACNVWKRGSPAEFSLYLTTKYGPDILQELVDLKHQTVKFSRSDLEEKISDYKARLEALQN